MELKLFLKKPFQFTLQCAIYVHTLIGKTNQSKIDAFVLEVLTVLKPMGSHVSLEYLYPTICLNPGLYAFDLRV